VLKYSPAARVLIPFDDLLLALARISH